MSRATVSYVLNDTPNQRIPESTRERVWEAVRRLDYAPSAAARALRSGRSDVVLWLMPDWPIGPGIGRILDQLTSALERVGLTLVVHSRVGDRGSSSPVWRSISPRAVILWELPGADELGALRAAGAEVVLALQGSAAPIMPGVVTLNVDQVARHTGQVQLEHLAARGHRVTGYAYPDDPRLATFAEPRLAGVRAACLDLGLPEPDVQVVRLEASLAAEAVDRWTERSDPVTAVCAFNDEVALAVLAGLRVRDLRAPADLAVVGVDDLPIAQLGDPPLTSVHEDPTALVNHLVQALRAGLTGDWKPRPLDDGLIQLCARKST